jgi:hypothetical protein
MHADFGSAVAEWRDFYASVAGATATLLGLLFVALALNPSVMHDDSPNGMRVWAGETFHNFLVVLAIAFCALIPDQGELGMGIPLVVLGAQGAYRVVHDVREARRDPDPLWRDMQALTRFAAPGIAYLLILWSGIEALMADEDAMVLLIPAIFLLIIGAAGSCWDLLKEIGNQNASRRPSNEPDA